MDDKKINNQQPNQPLQQTPPSPPVQNPVSEPSLIQNNESPTVSSAPNFFSNTAFNQHKKPKSKELILIAIPSIIIFVAGIVPHSLIDVLAL